MRGTFAWFMEMVVEDDVLIATVLHQKAAGDVPKR